MSPLRVVGLLSIVSGLDDPIRVGGQTLRVAGSPTGGRADLTQTCRTSRRTQRTSHKILPKRVCLLPIFPQNRHHEERGVRRSSKLLLSVSEFLMSLSVAISLHPSRSINVHHFRLFQFLLMYPLQNIRHIMPTFLKLDKQVTV